MSSYDFQSINLGFSRKAEVYDAYCAGHPVIVWSRAQARAAVLKRIGPGDSILELNAGTGADAAFLAQAGYRVHATDLADGMLAATQAKINALGLGDRFTAQQVSFTQLDQIKGGRFDLIFSNFGGLNCIPDLRGVAAQLPRVLKPGGCLVWVIMPPVCPWELAQLLRGHWPTAIRRLRRGGVLATVAGAQFMTYYFTPTTVRQGLGPDFKVESLQSLSLLCPPSYMENFAKRWPHLTRWLMQADEVVGRWPVCNGWGDYFILTARYLPNV